LCCKHRCRGRRKHQSRDERKRVRRARIGAGLVGAAFLGAGDHGWRERVAAEPGFDDDANEVKRDERLQHTERRLVRFGKVDAAHAGEWARGLLTAAEKTSDDHHAHNREQEEDGDAAKRVMAKVALWLRGKDVAYVRDNGAGSGGEVSETCALITNESPNDPEDEKSGDRFTGITVQACRRTFLAAAEPRHRKQNDERPME
jgi:hypothetical protein